MASVLRQSTNGRPIAALLVLAVSSASAAAGVDDLAEATASKTAFTIPPGSGTLEEIIGCESEDGQIYLAAVTPAEMPWRISIGMPKNSPQYGSRTQGREAAIEGMRHWERAIQTQFPWFTLEFVKKDRAAPVQIKWKRRSTGSSQGRAGPVCVMEGDRIIAGGRMEISVEACPTCSSLTVDEIELLLAHEFGHILGLGHCLECDSAMNYSWQTEGRVHVTQVDVDAIARRFEMADTGTGKQAGTPDDPAAAGEPEETENSIEVEDLVELAKAATSIHHDDWSCETPFRLTRSCSDRGPKKKREAGGLDLLVAATRDGTVIFVTPVDFGRLSEWPAQDRYYAVVEAMEEECLVAVSATAMLADGFALGYWIEFDGNAWSALK